jgi:membrane-bound lytic murein transglycosylase B
MPKTSKPKPPSTKKSHTTSTSAKNPRAKKSRSKRSSAKKTPQKHHTINQLIQSLWLALKPASKKSRTKKPRSMTKRKASSQPQQAPSKTIIKYTLIGLACLALYWMVVYYPKRHRQAIMDRTLANVPDYYHTLYGKELSSDLKHELTQLKFSDKTLQNYHSFIDTNHISQSIGQIDGYANTDKLAQQHYASRRIYLTSHHTTTASTSSKTYKDTHIKYQKLLTHYQQNLPLASIRKKYKKLSPELGNLSGIPASTILAILGCESAWGNLVGNYPMDFDLLSSLATLASTVPDPKKRFYYLDNLLAYLNMRMEHIPIHSLNQTLIKQSTFDGGMGIPQFEPISYIKYAKDGDTQPPVDIWESMPDAAASVANYLKQHGWQTGLKWGYFANVHYNSSMIKLAKTKHYQSIQQWQQQGALLPHQSKLLPIKVAQTKARLFIPDYANKQGVAFLITKNFDVLMRWNPSESEALMIGIIANIMDNTSLDYNSFTGS